MTKSILIHANSGNNVGLGHLVRCGTLAVELQSRNIDVTLRVKRDDEAVAFVREQGVNPVVSDPATLCEDIRTSTADIVVVDSYDFTAEDFELLTRNKTLVVVDELGDRQIPADLVINNNIYAHDIAYPSAKTVLRGPDYCMLREQFRNLPDPTYADPPKRALLTVGGADLTNEFIDLLEVMREVLPVETALDTIVGPYFDDLLTQPDGVNIYRNPNNIPELMLRAELATSGGGQTLYELAACGTPAAALTLGKDQVKNIDAFTEHGFCFNVNQTTGLVSEEQLKETVRKLLDTETRKKMGQTGRELVDGKGVRRVADYLERM